MPAWLDLPAINRKKKLPEVHPSGSFSRYKSGF